VKPYPGPLPLEGSESQPPRQAFTYSPPPSTNHSRFDAANQIETEKTPSQITTFTFDANGNTEVENAGGSLTTYTWNVDNMCVGIALPSGSLNTFAYDADLRRRQAQDSAGLAKFINDLDNVLAETDSGGTTQVAYTLEPQTYGNLVSQRRSGATAWHLFDALGSTERLTGSDQAALATYLNTAFGVPKVATGNHPNRLRWVGRLGYRWEPDASQYDLRRRRAQPSRGRFVSVDPAQAKVNAFSYANNSPCESGDPSGLECVVLGVSVQKALPKRMWKPFSYKGGYVSAAIQNLKILATLCCTNAKSAESAQAFQWLSAKQTYGKPPVKDSARTTPAGYWCADDYERWASCDGNPELQLGPSKPQKVSPTQKCGGSRKWIGDIYKVRWWDCPGYGAPTGMNKEQGCLFLSGGFASKDMFPIEIHGTFRTCVGFLGKNEPALNACRPGQTHYWKLDCTVSLGTEPKYEIMTIMKPGGLKEKV
jgi:RHS repeat-associated protein